MEGAVLKEICDEYASQQLVKEPTRSEYLLDVAFTDLPESKAKIFPSIADHKGILLSVKLPMPKTLKVNRKVWHFRNAAWHNLKCTLKQWSWERLKHGSVDAAMTYFMDSLQAEYSQNS